jgi:hypothetical protein
MAHYCRDLAKIITAAKRMTPAIAQIRKTCSSVTAYLSGGRRRLAAQDGWYACNGRVAA